VKIPIERHEKDRVTIHQRRRWQGQKSVPGRHVVEKGLKVNTAMSERLW
jgi:hypothetical protein